TGPEPTIVLTLFGGVTSGHSLWHLDRQPLCVLQRSGSAYNCTPQYDTLELGRDIGTSLVVGASGSYFPSPHLGAQATIFYLGFPFDDLCRGVYVDDHPKTTSFSIQPAAGFTARLSPGYQFRFELSDAVIPLQRVVGPAGDLGVPVAGSRTYHHLIFSMGLDVVLERKRGRRY